MERERRVGDAHMAWAVLLVAASFVAPSARETKTFPVQEKYQHMRRRHWKAVETYGRHIIY
jgi:hypothetical protein